MKTCSNCTWLRRKQSRKYPGYKCNKFHYNLYSWDINKDYCSKFSIKQKYELPPGEVPEPSNDPDLEYQFGKDKVYKKVYCENCRYYYCQDNGYDYCEHKNNKEIAHTYKTPIRDYDKRPGSINDRNNCKDYRKKWWGVICK